MCCGMKIVKTAACQPINLFELDERHSTLRPCNLVVNGSWRSIILQQQQQQLWKKYALHSCIRMCSTATHATSQTNNIPIRMAYVFISITYFMLFLALTYQHYNFISLHVRIIECNSFFAIYFITLIIFIMPFRLVYVVVVVAVWAYKRILRLLEAVHWSFDNFCHSIKAPVPIAFIICQRREIPF